MHGQTKPPHFKNFLPIRAIKWAGRPTKPADSIGKLIYQTGRSYSIGGLPWQSCVLNWWTDLPNRHAAVVQKQKRPVVFFWYVHCPFASRHSARPSPPQCRIHKNKGSQPAERARPNCRRECRNRQPGGARSWERSGPHWLDNRDCGFMSSVPRCGGDRFILQIAARCAVRS